MRRVFQYSVLLGLLAGLTGAGKENPQDAATLETTVRDLRKTLADLDDRIRHLEQLIKQLSRTSKKSSDKQLETQLRALLTPMIQYSLSRQAQKEQENRTKPP